MFVRFLKDVDKVAVDNVGVDVRSFKKGEIVGLHASVAETVCRGRDNALAKLVSDDEVKAHVKQQSSVAAAVEKAAKSGGKKPSDKDTE